jgi:hypothetical protein
MLRLPLRHDWAELANERPLDVQMADLSLAVDGTLAARVAQIREELDARGLRCPLRSGGRTVFL